MRSLSGYRWEYSPLAHYGNWIWARAIDPMLQIFADGDLAFLRRIRGVIQIILLTAIVLIVASFRFSPAHLLTASGLLFDIAGALRLFLVEELVEALGGFKQNKARNLPSVAMRELIMPEESGPYDSDSPYMSNFYYRKRGVLFLFVGFALQMVGDLFGG
jgi:hypothetical protein